MDSKFDLDLTYFAQSMELDILPVEDIVYDDLPSEEFYLIGE